MKTAFSITNQARVRAAFWEQHPHYTRQGRKTQNQYPANVRQAFCEFVDMLEKSGEISEKLAFRVTL
jgi:ferric iron reductase protein FhuF